MEREADAGKLVIIAPVFADKTCVSGARCDLDYDGIGLRPVDRVRVMTTCNHQSISSEFYEDGVEPPQDNAKPVR